MDLQILPILLILFRCILVTDDYKKINEGILADVAPTLLTIYGSSYSSGYDRESTCIIISVLSVPPLCSSV